MLVYTCNVIDRTIIATLGQAIKVDLKISDAELGLLQGIAFALFYTILGIPLARVAERWNRVSLISICLALWSTMTALCGSATSYLQLFLYRMGVGIVVDGYVFPQSARDGIVHARHRRQQRVRFGGAGTRD